MVLAEVFGSRGKIKDDRAQCGFVKRVDLVGEGLDWLKELVDRGFSRSD